MKKFEYKIMTDDDFSGFILDTLNQLGKEGWEMCGVFSEIKIHEDEKNYFTTQEENYYFKREIK